MKILYFAWLRQRIGTDTEEFVLTNEIETFDPVNGPVKSKTEIELEGRRALDKQGKPTPVSEMQVRKELSRQMTRVVTNLVKEQKELIDSDSSILYSLSVF